jgi:hypothetical protein
VYALARHGHVHSSQVEQWIIHGGSISTFELSRSPERQIRRIEAFRRSAMAGSCRSGRSGALAAGADKPQPAAHGRKRGSRPREAGVPPPAEPQSARAKVHRGGLPRRRLRAEGPRGHVHAQQHADAFVQRSFLPVRIGCLPMPVGNEAPRRDPPPECSLMKVPKHWSAH